MRSEGKSILGDSWSGEALRSTPVMKMLRNNPNVVWGSNFPTSIPGSQAELGGRAGLVEARTLARALSPGPWLVVPGILSDLVVPAMWFSTRSVGVLLLASTGLLRQGLWRKDRVLCKKCLDYFSSDCHPPLVGQRDSRRFFLLFGSKIAAGLSRIPIARETSTLSHPLCPSQIFGAPLAPARVRGGGSGSSRD